MKNMVWKAIVPLLFCVGMLCAKELPPERKVDRSTIAPGVTYEKISDPAGPWEIRLIKIDAQAMKDYEFRISEANDVCPGLETTLDAYNRAKAKKIPVIAAINGDSYYYRDGKKLGQPRAVTVVNGRFFSIGDLRNRANLFQDAAGKFTVGRGNIQGSTVTVGKETYPLLALNDILINGYQEVNGVFAYNMDWGKLATPGVGIAVKLAQVQLTLPGDFNGMVKGKVEAGPVAGTDLSELVLVGFGSAAKIADTARNTPVSLHLAVNPAPGKAPYKLVLGGMGIVRQGDKSFPETDTSRHPRTFWGCGKNCIVFGIVDGRRKGWSVGMNYQELDDLLHPYGLDQIINLDGGGSTTLVIKGEIQNKPSDNHPRRTGNHLLLVRRR